MHVAGAAGCSGSGPPLRCSAEGSVILYCVPWAHDNKADEMGVIVHTGCHGSGPPPRHSEGEGEQTPSRCLQNAGSHRNAACEGGEALHQCGAGSTVCGHASTRACLLIHVWNPLSLARVVEQRSAPLLLADVLHTMHTNARAEARVRAHTHTHTHRTTRSHDWHLAQPFPAALTHTYHHTHTHPHTRPHPHCRSHSLTCRSSGPHDRHLVQPLPAAAPHSRPAHGTRAAHHPTLLQPHPPLNVRPCTAPP